MNNTGSLRVYKKKETPQQKDYQGKCTIAGKDYWIAGWKKERDGDTWLSLSFDEIPETDL